MDLLTDLKNLAKYYKEVLASVSQHSGKHLLDLAKTIKYGLTADVSCFINDWNLIVNNEVVRIKIDKASPDVVLEILNKAEEIDEDSNGADDIDPDEGRSINSARLIAIFRKQQFDVFNRETIIGFPLVVGKRGTKHFCAPLFYFPISVDFEHNTGTIVITRNVEMPTFNTYLISNLVKSDDELDIVRHRILPIIHNSEFNYETIKSVLEILSQLIESLRGMKCSSGNVVSLDESLKCRENETFKVMFTPVVINSSRTNAFVQDDLSELSKIEKLDGDTVLETILSEVPESVELDDNFDGYEVQNAVPLFFPDLSNKAQRRAARKAEKAKLCVVQGPPGTGKSQTISNLVCHLTALGKTVLVTSHQNKALEVINNKLPEIDYLAMSFMKGERATIEELLNKLEHYESIVSNRTVGNLDQEFKSSVIEISRSIEQSNQLKRRFSELKIIEKDKYTNYKRYYDIRNYEGIHENDSLPDGIDNHWGVSIIKWAEIIIAIKELFETYEMVLVDAKTMDDKRLLLKHICKISELLILLRNNRQKLSSSYIDNKESDYPALVNWKSVFVKWLTDEGLKLSRNYEMYLKYGGKLNLLDIYKKCQLSTKEVLIAVIKEYSNVKDNTFDYISKGKPRKEFPSEPNARTISEVKSNLRNVSGTSKGIAWYFPAAIFSRKKLTELGFGIITKSAIVEVIDWIEYWANYWSTKESLCVKLNSLHNVSIEDYVYSSSVDDKNIIDGYQRNKHLLEIMSSFLSIINIDNRDYMLREVSDYWEKITSENSLKEFINVQYELIRYYQNVSQINVFRDGGGLKRFWTKYGNGSNENGVEMSYAGIREVYIDDIRCLADKSVQYMLQEEINLTVMNNIPKTKSALLQKLIAGEKVFWLDNPKYAFEYYRLRKMIDEDLIKNPDDINEISTSILGINQRIRKVVIKALQAGRLLALKKATQDRAVAQQIIKFRKVIKRKRKTISFLELRNDVDYEKILKVFPCWIMNIDDVPRVFPLKAGLFDYIIVDEASQCNQASVFPLMIRAKRMIVVGDQKQLKNASAKFIKDDFIKLLLTRNNLDKHPKREFINVKNSLLELCEYCANTTEFLNEHFRCEPEIIEWSNKHFYDNKLRIMTPKRAKRFEPVMEIKILTNADDDPASKINVNEAEAVIYELKNILANEKTKGMSIGVISPFREQANLINNMIYEKFSNEMGAIKEREIISSTADGFQGDERDIIVYSMRYGVSSSPGVINGIEIERERINVAFTRARQKVICLISRGVDEFPKGFIRSYLEHVLVKGTASTTGVDDKFDSEFERIVCGMFRTNNLKVRTQVPCAGFFIDLVISDNEMREMAIECDGDFHYEDGELRAEDYQRQDIIERAGYLVRRIPASKFYINPEAEIGDICESLNKMSKPYEIKEENVVRIEDVITQKRVVSEIKYIEEVVKQIEIPQTNLISINPKLQESIKEVNVQLRILEEKERYEISKEEGTVIVNKVDILIPEMWFELSHWGKASCEFTGYANSFCYDLGKRISRGVELSEKQITYAMKLLNKAKEKGYVYEGNKNNNMSRNKNDK